MFETRRLRVRLADAKDARAVVDYFRRNREHLRPWNPVPPRAYLTEEWWLRQIDGYREEADSGDGYHLFMFKRRPSALIGTLSLTNVVRGSMQGCHVGYGLDAREQGHGYMQEALEGAVRFAFTQLNLHRVMANYMPHNVRSAAVLRRAGFTVEGYARDYLFINGAWEDHVLTAIMNPAWKPPE